MRVVVANFDAELQFARAHTPGPHAPLPTKVRRHLSQLATRLAIFCRPGDGLWTLDVLAAPADAAFQPRHGELALDEVDAALPWAFAAPWMASTHTAVDDGQPWQDVLWRLGCPPEVAARCNDRRFALALHQNSPEGADLASESVAVVANLDELDAYLRTARLGPGDAWIVKAPFSASGRERLRRHGRALEGEERVFVGRLLQRYGQLLVEAWLPRVADYGVAGLVFEGSIQVFAPHRLSCDSTGVVREIRIADDEVSQELGSQDTAILRARAQQVGSSLQTAGYRGPFGIDAFVYQDETTKAGALRLRSLCEINARMTMGLVARAWAEAEPSVDYRMRW